MDRLMEQIVLFFNREWNLEQLVRWLTRPFIWWEIKLIEDIIDLIEDKWDQREEDTPVFGMRKYWITLHRPISLLDSGRTLRDIGGWSITVCSFLCLEFGTGRRWTFRSRRRPFLRRGFAKWWRHRHSNADKPDSSLFLHLRDKERRIRWTRFEPTWT